MSTGEWLLYAQVVTIERVSTWGRTVGDRMARRLRDEKGQTPTEYLMIVGLMAAVIVIAFVTYYWGQVKTAASTWVTRVRDAITGTSITP